MRDCSEEEKETEGEGVSDVEPDLRPEYCHYQDQGCEFAGSCLNCPFPQCLYDTPRGKQRWLKEARNKQINRIFNDGEWGVKELAALFGLSQRTVQRALKESNR